MPQSLSKLYTHLVFSTLNREHRLADAWRDELFRLLGGTANNIGCPSVTVGGMPDHVHMLFLLSRTVAVADAVRQIKSASSSWINQTRGIDSQFHWQGGYAAFSVSQSNVDAVVEYIRRQPEHHVKRSFQDEFRELLRRHQIEWDDQYVWT